ncbi:hypothetical protein IAG44_29630 [Streptomyces roseirectus]|uniref:Uncharacterized protein n=1 Tax=Streptomyces roseirectus TaxID=2768066 RepID=A0A7H0IK74_9ACTN|nr:hypothetical protein [Streptomyces roseirectus]QNP73190.1 hypothetical protein IAG44_29630 [Streptomyces roseirectus]
MVVLNVVFSEAAARVRDGLSPERRELLERGLLLLGKDPRTKVSAPIAGDVLFEDED